MHPLRIFTSLSSSEIHLSEIHQDYPKIAFKWSVKDLKPTTAFCHIPEFHHTHFNWTKIYIWFLTFSHICLFSAGGWAARSAEETEGNRRWTGQVLRGPEGCSGETGTVGEEGHRREFTTKTPSERHYYSGTPQLLKYQYQILHMDWNRYHSMRGEKGTSNMDTHSSLSKLV